LRLTFQSTRPSPQFRGPIPGAGGVLTVVHPALEIVLDRHERAHELVVLPQGDGPLDIGTRRGIDQVGSLLRGVVPVTPADGDRVEPARERHGARAVEGGGATVPVAGVPPVDGVADVEVVEADDADARILVGERGAGGGIEVGCRPLDPRGGLAGGEQDEAEHGAHPPILTSFPAGSRRVAGNIAARAIGARMALLLLPHSAALAAALPEHLLLADIGLHVVGVGYQHAIGPRFAAHPALESYTPWTQNIAF
jgi:hypothetical protein